MVLATVAGLRPRENVERCHRSRSKRYDVAELSLVVGVHQSADRHVGIHNDEVDGIQQSCCDLKPRTPVQG